MNKSEKNPGRKYHQFISNYIHENSHSPSLKQIAEHFHVTSPTAHKALKELQEKHLLYFDRDDVSGFYIRVPERIASAERLIEIPILGFGNRNGEVREFPKKIGHFPVVLAGLPDYQVFSIELWQHIPSEDMLAGDKIIFHRQSEPKSGDIVIMNLGKRLFLCRLYSFEDRKLNPVYDLIYPLVDDHEEEMKKSRSSLFLWWPIGHDDYSDDFFADYITSLQIKYAPVSTEDIFGTAIRLDRSTAM